MTPFKKRNASSKNVGLELFEIQPVILGGSVTDPANKVSLTRDQHIEAVRYWNQVINDFRKNVGKKL